MCMRMCVCARTRACRFARADNCMALVLAARSQRSVESLPVATRDLSNAERYPAACIITFDSKRGANKLAPTVKAVRE